MFLASRHALAIMRIIYMHSFSNERIILEKKLIIHSTNETLITIRLTFFNIKIQYKSLTFKNKFTTVIYFHRMFTSIP